MTIEEKAKAYDKAIERVVNIRTGKCETTFIFTEGLFDYLFPELEECNEEEVRKAMIDFFKHEREEGVVVSHYGVNIERMIAWLEKQGQVNETIISQHEDKICKENNDSLTSEDERIKKYLLSMFSDPNDSWDGISAREIIAWLEKQGETFTKKDVDDAWLEGMYYAKHELEKQGEQKPADKVEPKDYNSIDPHFGKPADKVEPKFQNGQWIVWQDKCYKVNYNGCGYELIDQNGLSTSLEYGTIDENAHLWDITKDAKDGDVLCYKDEISLYKHDIKNCTKQGTTFGGFVYHCCYDGKRFIVDSFYSLTEQDKMGIHPATKEQRDTFEKAMVDAGWEFDFEKKELKKISQRIISAEAKEAMYGKPTAWSEDDEAGLGDAMWAIEQARTIAKDENDMGNLWYAEHWLKSLKSRVQPKQEWSEEDALRLEEVMCMIEANGRWVRSDDAVKSVLDWLKSLQQRIGE